jgi:hypothetical protein
MHGQTPIPIFGPDSAKSWQYYQAGNEPAPISGVNWKATNYNDTAWSSGSAVFYYEDTQGAYPPFNTPLNRTYDGVNTNITYYFRTQFNFSLNPTNAILYFTNFIDDGLVAYLNGTEIYRFRVTGNPPTWGTRAGGTPAEGAPEVVTLNTPLLRRGTNVIAVELHDGGIGSSDVVFGMGLAYALPEAVVITKHPPSKIEAVEFDDITLEVEVDGTSPRYWWFRNNVFVTGQTNRTYPLSNITLAQAGTYHVVVSNAISGARGSNTVITVVPDSFGPRLVDAFVAEGETNRILLQFNEDVNRSAGTLPISGANSNNYIVTTLGDFNPANRIPVTLAQPAVGNGQVRLTLATNLNRGTNYQICIYNIGDVRGNIIAWRSCFPVGYQGSTNAFDWESLFSYNEWGESLDDTNWTALNYTGAVFPKWNDEPGAFYGSFSETNDACVSEGKTMSIGSSTYYFRKRFVLTTNLAGIKVDATLSHAINDGVVFYLNGVELARYNMPLGPVTFGTRASTIWQNICRSNTFNDMVLPRTNILAAELHQSAAFPTDLTAGFGAELTLKFIQYPRSTAFPGATNIKLFTTNFSPTQVAVFYTNLNAYGWAFQRTTNLTEAWREAQPPGSNLLVVPKANPRQFYRATKVH